MAKISVWQINCDPGTKLEIPLWGLVCNKSVIEVPGPLYYFNKDGEQVETEFLVLGEPIPKGEEWAGPEQPPSVFTTGQIPVVHVEEGEG